MSSQFNTGQVLFADQTNKIRTLKITIPFTTVEIFRDFLQEFGMQMVLLIINNRDVVNEVTFRTEQNAILERIPASTRGTVTDEIHHFLQVTPDGVTGLGEITAFIAPTKELLRLGLIAS